MRSLPCVCCCLGRDGRCGMTWGSWSSYCKRVVFLSGLPEEKAQGFSFVKWRVRAPNGQTEKCSPLCWTDCVQNPNPSSHAEAWIPKGALSGESAFKEVCVVKRAPVAGLWPDRTAVPNKTRKKQQRFSICLHISKSHARTQREGSCLQAREGGLPRNQPG